MRIEKKFHKPFISRNKKLYKSYLCKLFTTYRNENNRHRNWKCTTGDDSFVWHWSKFIGGFVVTFIGKYVITVSANLLDYVGSIISVGRKPWRTFQVKVLCLFAWARMLYDLLNVKHMSFDLPPTWKRYIIMNYCIFQNSFSCQFNKFGLCTTDAIQNHILMLVSIWLQWNGYIICFKIKDLNYLFILTSILKSKWSQLSFTTAYHYATSNVSIL